MTEVEFESKSDSHAWILGLQWVVSLPSLMPGLSSPNLALSDFVGTDLLKHSPGPYSDLWSC